MKSYTHCVQPAMSMVNIPPKKNGDDLGMVDDIGFTTLYHMNSTNFFQKWHQNQSIFSQNLHQKPKKSIHVLIFLQNHQK